MSGGYYEYVGWKDIEELILYHNQSQLDGIHKRLLGLNYSQDAAIATGRILNDIREFMESMTPCIQEIREVWQELEYWDSNDHSELQFKDALKRWRARVSTEPFIGENI